MKPCAGLLDYFKVKEITLEFVDEKHVKVTSQGRLLMVFDMHTHKIIFEVRE